MVDEVKLEMQDLPEFTEEFIKLFLDYQEDPEAMAKIVWNMANAYYRKAAEESDDE